MAMNDIAQLREAIQALEAKGEKRKSEMEDLRKENTNLTKQVIEMKKEMENLKFQTYRANTKASVLADKDKTCFLSVWDNSSPLIKGTAVRLENFNTGKESSRCLPCNYMDFKTGVYTTPIEGGYIFTVLTSLESTDLYLCSDDGQRDLLDKMDTASYEYKYFQSVEWTLGDNVKVWLEALSREADAEGLVRFNGCEQEALK